VLNLVYCDAFFASRLIRIISFTLRKRGKNQNEHPCYLSAFIDLIRISNAPFNTVTLH
jgi:hypothetical protein